MKRRVLAIVLAAAAVSGGQGSLMYAAALPSAERPALGQAAQPLVATRIVAQLATSLSQLPGSVIDDPIECLRGGYYCFGYGSNSCCAEVHTLAAIAGAVGAWLAAGVATYYAYQYCW